MDNFFQAAMALCLHSVFLSRKAELDQFITGLGPVHSIIKQHPVLAEALFLVGKGKPLTAEEFLSLVVIQDVQPNIANFFNEYLRTSEGR